MNLPNKLTMMRICLIPVFFVLMMIGGTVCGILAALVFVVASLTDLLDGYIARRDNLITDFGKLMDPIADKLLVMAALVLLTYRQRVNPIVSVILLGREFLISGIRLVAASNGRVVPAGKIGKYKTTAQMIGLTILIVFYKGFFEVVGQIFIWTSVVLSVWSCIEYIKQNSDVFKEV